jgi:signal transduction histidine kinase
MNQLKGNVDMFIKEHVSNSYPIVNAYEGVSEVIDKLQENGFLVVFDEGQYLGVLTPSDILCRPHKLVIDCLSNKEKLESTDTLEVALNRLRKEETVALPVYSGERYEGVISKNYLIGMLHEQITELQQRVNAIQGIKTEFLKNLAHEIRTPLNGILPFIEILSTLDIDEIKENSDYINDQIRTNADRFLRAMNDLIDLSLIESGEAIKLKIDKTNIVSVFHKIKHNVKNSESYKDNKLSINDYIFDPTIELVTDCRALERILSHLVNNAVKFCSPNSTIRFGMDRLEDSKVVFMVENTGSKIDHEKQIFEIFERRVNTDQNYSEGLGIGLSISKKLIERLGGSIQVKKRNDKKTVFEFSISQHLRD